MADLHDEKIPVGRVSCHFDVPQEFFRLQIQLLLEIRQVVPPVSRHWQIDPEQNKRQYVCMCVHIKHSRFFRQDCVSGRE